MQKTQLFYGAIVLFIMLAGCAPKHQRSFQTTLENHLRAIQQRDLDAYIATLPAAEDTELYLIYSSGKKITDREKIIEFHREWFAKTNWKFKTENIRQVVTRDMGLVLLKVHYEDLDDNGEPFEMILHLNLVFQRINEKWVLVHDQNTLISDSRKSP